MPRNRRLNLLEKKRDGVVLVALDGNRERYLTRIDCLIKKKLKIYDLNKIIDIVGRYYKKDSKEILNSRLKGEREARGLII
ncbi:MAG: hypothetical protein ABII25_01455 [bacterium]